MNIKSKIMKMLCKSLAVIVLLLCTSCQKRCRVEFEISSNFTGHFKVQESLALPDEPRTALRINVDSNNVFIGKTSCLEAWISPTAFMDNGVQIAVDPMHLVDTNALCIWSLGANHRGEFHFLFGTKSQMLEFRDF